MTKTMRFAAAMFALAVITAACGGATNDAGAKQQPSARAVALDKGAPALQQKLTDLLDGHVYLASIAVVTGLGKGLDSAEFKAAAKTLDDNSVDLGKAIESVYGADAGAQFLKQWRDHIAFFVEYTAGKATKNEAKAGAALTKLQNYKKDFAAFLESATGGKLQSDAAAGALQMHVDSLVQAIDAAVAGDASVFSKVYAAASQHMPMTASALSTAIAGQFPEKFGR